MTLWGGRFKTKLDQAAWELNASLPVDRRLAAQDVSGSIAWAGALNKAGVLSDEEYAALRAGLQIIATEHASNQFAFAKEDEDIHTANERRLAELIGPLAGKLHTGRSRNDQVATDTRLWLIQNIPHTRAAVQALMAALLQRAQQDIDLLMPGYTHLQRAQPVLLSHWWLSYFWPLQRDLDRLDELAKRAAILPLGSGALAGTPFSIDREQLCKELGFTAPSPNSIDAVADRDFVAEYLFFAALLGVHISRLAEAMVLFATAEFGFFELSDAYATGSSLMPQKKNPDIFELARGKSGGLIGLLTGLLVTLKALPSAYDKDLQEDKSPLFAAHDTLSTLLPVFTGAILSVQARPARLRAALDPMLMVTELADYLVAQGIPFRDAHSLAGKMVQLAIDHDLALDKLPLSDYQATSPAFHADVYAVYDPENSVARRSTQGGTARQAVLLQIEQAQQVLSVSQS